MKKLIKISKEIDGMIKIYKCEEKYKDMILTWCKNIPIRKEVKDIWKFLQSIKEMLNN